MKEPGITANAKSHVGAYSLAQLAMNWILGLGLGLALSLSLQEG